MPDKDVTTDQADALGITWSAKNYIKSLWDLYCSNVTGLTFLSSDPDGLDESLPEQREEQQEHLSDEYVVRDILNSSCGDPGSPPTATLEEKIDWVDEQIIILYRLKGDLELSLRNASRNPGEQPVLPR